MSTPARRYITYVLRKFRPRGWRRLWRRWRRRKPLRRTWHMRRYAYRKYRAALARGRKARAALWLARHRAAKKKVAAIKAAQATRRTGCGSPGDPEWSGSASIVEKEVVPVFSALGIPITSRKRTSTLGNPSSDHYVGNTTAYAVDAGTYSGASAAHAVANALGISGYLTGNYTGYTIRRCDHTFRVQILWAVSGHYNHVHVGVRRV